MSNTETQETMNAGAEPNAAAHGNGAAAAETTPPEGRIAQLEEQVKEKENKYLYLYADFENFKKRVVKERSDLLKFGWERAARDLLNVVDNMERALQHAPEATDSNLLMGLKMVLTELYGTLEKQGIKRVEAVGRSFDPNLHEAVESVASDQPAGSIVKEHTSGFTLHGRLLRPARVAVSKGA
jgi:molecular chaperone GrpE